MHINPADVHYEYNTKGYMLYYKNQPIGGAGIDKFAKGCRSNLKLFRDSAELEKRAILNGRGRPDMIKEIQAINEREEINNA